MAKKKIPHYSVYSFLEHDDHNGRSYITFFTNPEKAVRYMRERYPEIYTPVVPDHSVVKDVVKLHLQ